MNQENNYSLILSRLIVHTLKNNNIDTFYISPGYRDAPMIAALLEEGLDVNLYSAMDERAASYMALGYVKASSKPCVLLCTSGTAAANYFPAVIEAKEDQLPLIVISCDRPGKLVNNGANQTIDQSNLYSSFVKKSISLDAPNASMDLYSIYQTVSLLRDIAVVAPKGPVHLNLPLVAPLEPRSDNNTEVTRLSNELSKLKSQKWNQSILPSLNLELSDEMKSKILESSRPVFLIGRMNRKQREKLKSIVGSINALCFYDLGSGMKFQDGFELMDLEISQMKNLLESYNPDLVMHFGKRLISKYFDIFLKEHSNVEYFVFSDYEYQQVAEHRVHTRVRFDGADALLKVLDLIGSKKYPPLDGIRELKFSFYERVKKSDFSSPKIAQTTIEMGDKWNYYVANSSVVRSFDSWTFTSAREVCDFEMNRGVSGIEGQLATAIGFSRFTKQNQLTFLGDVTAIHDLNSFLQLANTDYSHAVVVLNNQGGHIFDKLPISRFETVLNPFMSTPHQFEFSGICDMAGVTYFKVRDIDSYKEALRTCIKLKKAVVIECVLDARADVSLFDEIKKG